MRKILANMEYELEKTTENNNIYNTSFLDKDHDKNFASTKKFEKAAVLCLLDYHNDNFNVILTVRAKNLKNHPGQISFPGGKLNVEETYIECALRETFEEIGIKKKNINIIGGLNFYLSGSNFLIKPIVANTTGEYKLFLNRNEVEKIFFFPINFLFKKINLTKNFYENKRTNDKRFFYDINWNGMRIWGTTALILVHLSRILNRVI